MKLKKIKIDGLWQYDISDDLVSKMFNLAAKAKGNTYPKPGKVGVTLLTKKGNFYTGVSYHSDVYTLTMHAEMTALSHAAIHGETGILAITGPNCHICKQLLWESAIRSRIDPIILIKEGKTTKKIPLSEMMIYPWPDKDGH